jgi:hypothetical protein
VYRDPTQRLNGSGKDSLEQTPKQRSIMDTREFRRRMENGTQVMDGGMPHPQRMQQSTKMESEPPTRLISWVKLHVPGSTHVTHEAACLPSACVPSQELRTKHIFHMAFGIILKYYSQGLKPLGSTLSLSFQPSSPQSLTHSVEA